MNYKRIIQDKEKRKKILGLLKWIPDKYMIKVQYYLKTGRKLNLKNPRRFTEKLQWLKIYYRNPLMNYCLDKYKVRDYIERKGLGHLLTVLYGVYESYDQIDFNKLPSKYVIKYNLGGGGYNVLFSRGQHTLDRDFVKERVNEWIGEKNAKSSGREWVYDGGVPKIVIEELLEDMQNADKSVSDYKILCFNGKPCYIVYDHCRFSNHKRSVFDMEWQPVNVRDIEYENEENVDKPKNLQEMIRIAEILSEEFPFVRVDLYNIDGRIYFGELTFFPWSGYVLFQPDSFDEKLGDLLQLPDPNYNL